MSDETPSDQHPVEPTTTGRTEPTPVTEPIPAVPTTAPSVTNVPILTEPIPAVPTTAPSVTNVPIPAVSAVPTPVVLAPAAPRPAPGGGPPPSQPLMPMPTVPVATPALPTLPAPSSNFVPIAPIMGGLVQTGSYDVCPWTGGKPRADWSGLDPKAAPVPKDAYQYRPSSPGSAQKSTRYREMGLEDKFSMASNLTKLRQTMREYFARNGLDTITYLPNPFDPTETLSLLDSFSRFSTATATASAKILRATKFDKYDVENDDSARRWFMDSLDDDLKTKVVDRAPEDSGFIAHWMVFLHCFQSSSHAKYAKLKTDIEGIRITKYPQQDVSQMATDFLHLGTELTNACHYEHRLTQTMINRFLAAGGGDAGDIYAMQYRHPLFELNSKMDKALNYIAHLTKEEANDYMEKQELTFRNICEVAENEWKKLSDDGRWGPAKTHVDSRRLPGRFAANAAGLDEDLLLQALALVQQQSAGGSSKRNNDCLNCGKSGHWARDCPEKSVRPSSSKPNQGKGPGSEFHPRKKPDATWCTKQETVNGVDHWIYKRDGKTYHNCAKCRRWLLTHWTGTHTPKSSQSSQSEQKGGRQVRFKAPKTYLSAATASPSPSSRLSFFHFGCPGCPNEAEVEAPNDFSPLDSLSDMMLPHLPALFGIAMLLFGSLVFGPLLWLSIGVILGVGPQSFFPAEHWPRWYRRHCSRWYHRQHRRAVRAHVSHTLAPPSTPRHQAREWNKAKTRNRSAWTSAREGESRPFNQFDEATARHHFKRRHQFRRPGRGHSPSRFQRQPWNPRQVPIGQRNRTKQKQPSVFKPWNKVPWYNNPKSNAQSHCSPDQKTHKTHRATKSSTRGSVHPTVPFRLRSDISPDGPKTSKTPLRLHRFDFPNVKSHATVTPDDDCYFKTARNSYKSDPAPYEGDEGYYLPSTVRSYESNPVPDGHPSTTTSGFASMIPIALSSSNEDSFPVIWDSGASVCLSFDRNDFVGPMCAPTSSQSQSEGVGSNVRVKSVGHIAWSFIDTKGMLRTIKAPAVYVPDSKVRLASTSAICQAYNESITVTKNSLTLNGSSSTNAIVVPLDLSNNLPVAQAYNVNSLPKVSKKLVSAVNEVANANINLTEPEKEWLKWHQRLGHCGFSLVQLLCRSGVLASSQRGKSLHAAIGRLTSTPKCAACQYSKAKVKSWKGTPQRQPRTFRVQDLPKSSLTGSTVHPGQEISVDHFICSTHGRLYSGFGKTADESMYKGGCLFIDNASGFVHVEHQTAISAHETIRAKERFEAHCRDHGVLPQGYLSDNHKVFTSAEFTAHLRQFNQNIRHAGVGAHHMNGIAEKAIQDIQTMARTMLLHAAIHWPDVADVQLWPMAVDHAVYLHNRLPNMQSGVSPHDIFTKQRWATSKFHDCHVFGCPVYKLDKDIADGKKVGKWKARSERLINMGFSPKHASTVPLLLNPQTGAFTASYHVVFDDFFATVGSEPSEWPDFNADDWYHMFGDSPYQYPSPASDVPLDSFPERRQMEALDAFDPSASPYRPFHEASAPLEREEEPQVIAKRALPASKPPAYAPRVLQATPPPPQQREMPQQRETPAPLPTPTPAPQKSAPAPIPAPASSAPSPVEQRELPSQRKPPSMKSPPPKKSPPKVNRELHRLSDFNSPGSTELGPRERRERRKPARFMASMMKDVAGSSLPQEHYSPNHECYTRFSSESPFGYYALKVQGNEHVNKLYLYQVELPDTFEVEFPADLDFMASSKTKSDPDTLTWDQAMAESPENRAQWLKSADKEIEALESKGTFDEVPESAATVRIIPGTWVFRRKRDPATGEITKWKARWVLRGDLQELDMETHAPTVSWASVRMFLAICLILNWTMKALDFANAFCQSPLGDIPIYAFLPRGYRVQQEAKAGERTILKLKKSQYGTTVAPRLWFLFLRKALLEIGFVASSTDPCLMFQAGMILVIYVDDCGLGVEDPKKVDWFVDELRKRGFELEVEGNFTAFLGVAVDKLPDGRIHMHQSALIDKIIETAGMENCNPNHTPAAPKAPGPDPDGPLWPQTPWKYSSIVGMMVYLATNTRPDISYAVSCVGRYNREPRVSHATAVKIIIRYLKGTRDKGIIIDIRKEFSLITYSDADFCGLFGTDDAREPNSARSRGGYIISLGGVPLIWKSFLISRICLSTLESEYACLSRTMIQVITFLAMLKEVVAGIGIEASLSSTLSSTVFEDNNGALLLATNQRITSRTKYFLSSWHHFWSEVSEDGGADGKTVILKIATDKQRADYFTKGLVRELFENCRMLNQGY